MNKWLKSFFEVVDIGIVGPDVCFEAETGLDVDFVFVVQHNHTLSNFASRILQPLLTILRYADENGADLSSFDASYGDSVAMQTFNLHNCKSTLMVWPQKSFLI